MPVKFLPDSLHALLKRGSSLLAAQLQAATGKSQASISLALKQLGAQVHKLGAARTTRYALTQDILGLPASHDLLWDSAGGTPQRFASFAYLQNDGLGAWAGNPQPNNRCNCYVQRRWQRQFIKGR